jgi:hypothetical protein
MRNLHKRVKPGLFLTYMVGKILISFAGLVGLFMILMYPGQILELIQLIVDAAHNIAKGLSNLDVPKKGQ